MGRLLWLLFMQVKSQRFSRLQWVDFALERDFCGRPFAPVAGYGQEFRGHSDVKPFTLVFVSHGQFRQIIGNIRI